MPERRWELLPHFILRSTGFPFEWLERLAFHNTEARLDALHAHEQRLAQAQQELVAALRTAPDADSRRLRRKLCERVTRTLPVVIDDEARPALGEPLVARLCTWNLALQQRDQLEQRARGTFANELTERRAELRELVRNDWFQEAVWLSSPQMLEHGLRPYLARWDAEHRPSEVRRLERQLMAYIQRVCAKNETTSFFGPINYGDFQAPGETAHRLGAPSVQRREVFVAYWGVVALVTSLAAEPDLQPYLQPSISPICALDLASGTATIAEAATIPLSAAARALLPFVDGSTSTAEIAAAAGLPLPGVLDELVTLERLRALVLAPRPPVTDVQPLVWLCNWVAALPAGCPARTRWLADLQEIERMRCRFRCAGLTERIALLAEIERTFEALTGLDPRRKGGEMYADRLLVYEECVGGASPLSLGATAQRELYAQLTPVLDLYAAHACAEQTQLRDLAVDALRRLAPDSSLPFLRLVSALRGTSLGTEHETPWQAAVQAHIERNPDARELSLDRANLPPVDRATLEREALLTSPDVLLLADDEAAVQRGDFQLVVGECHDTVMLWGWPLALHDDGARLEAAAAELIRRAQPTDRSVASVLASKRVKITPFEYPGPTIEVLATSQKPAPQRVSVAQVSAKVNDGQPVLTAPGHPALHLYNGELPSLAHRMFGLPRVVPPRLADRAHTPRLTLGKAIVQRERWQVVREDLLPARYAGTSFELMRDWHRARRQLGLPRFVFARIDGERKPVLVDSANYFLLELLESLVKPGNGMVLSEMLPTPEQLWLRDGTGSYCAELRLSAGYTRDV